MSRGTVKFFNPEKGFGFINVDDGREVFLPKATVEHTGGDTVFPGQVVEFDEKPGKRGPVTINLQVLSAPALA